MIGTEIVIYRLRDTGHDELNCNTRHNGAQHKVSLCLSVFIAIDVIIKNVVAPYNCIQ
jgi:hypothetical protein